MMYVKRLLLSALLLTAIMLFSNAQPLYSPEQLKADIDTMVRYLEDTHINPYYRYGKALFYKDVEQVKDQLRQPLDVTSFYLRVQPLLGKLEDGHTDIKPPLALYNQQNPYELPYAVKLSATPPYITFTKAYLTTPLPLPAATEIISINGIPAQKITEDIINLNTGETRAFRADFGAGYFNYYLHTLYKTGETYTIHYRLNGRKIKAVVKGIRRNVLLNKIKVQETHINQQHKAQSDYHLNILPNNSTAILDLPTFDNLQHFDTFLDSAFTVMAAENIQNLIIDLRKNSGGDSDIGDAILQYLARTPFRQYDKVIEKHSPLLIQRLLKQKAGKNLSKWDSAFINKPAHVVSTETYDDITLTTIPNRFTGKLYVLTSTYTFSSAADFAQAVKHYKLGKIIGEETGGWIISYGDIVTSRLPNTGLTFTISSKLYYNMGAGVKDWHGVIPDIAQPADEAMQYTLSLIQKAYP